MEGALKIVTQWLPSWTDSKRNRVSQSFSSLLLEFRTSFEEIVRKDPVTRSITDPYIILSGALCFYAGLLLAIIKNSPLSLKDRCRVLFSFTSLYMLVDHYLDDPSSLSKDKEEFVSQMSQALRNPFAPSENSFVENVLTHIRIILQISPASYVPLMSLFYLEIFSTSLQTTSLDERKSRDEYLFLCLDKGGKTVSVIETLLHLPISDDGYNLGACFQLVDDLYDCRRDLQDNLLTVATFDYHTLGHLDNLLFFTIKHIDNLPKDFLIFKILLLLMVMSCVGTQDVFSSSVKHAFSAYCPVKSDFKVCGLQGKTQGN